MDLLSCFPAEWQDDYKRRLEASKTRKFRAMQDAAIETAKKGQMRFDVQGRCLTEPAQTDLPACCRRRS